MSSKQREEAITKALEETESPEVLKNMIEGMEVFEDTKAIYSFESDVNYVQGAVQYWTSTADELVENHPDYAKRVNESHEFFMSLTDSQREAVISAGQEILGYIYKHIAAWVPYSLVLQANDTDVTGVGFYFNIIFADLNEVVREKEETGILEASAALDALGGLLEDDDTNVTPQEEGQLTVLFGVEASAQIVSKAEARGLTPGEYVAEVMSSVDG